MSTTLESPPTNQQTTAAARLRATMAAVRVSLSWFGVRKALTQEQKNQAAESFGASGDFVSAGKKLLDTSHPAFKAVSNVRFRLNSYWKGITLPYPEPSIRLIRQDDIASFDAQMATICAELHQAVAQLDEQYTALQTAAQKRLGTLFNAADYPSSLIGLFSVEWEYPSIEPPDYLRVLNPELFAQEQTRVAARFDEVVRLAEEAFTNELARLVSHLAERLSGVNDGRPKIFRDSAVHNLTEFFDRFRQLNVRSNAELDELVDRVQRLVRGIEPQELRDSDSLRHHVSNELQTVHSALDNLLVDRPRRNILRRPH